MSLPRYAEYKDSGVEWLGDVPAHWEVARLKRVLSEIGSGGTPETNNSEFWSDIDGTPWVAIADMSSTEKVLRTAKTLTLRGIEARRLRIWPKGTLLFSMYASLGHVAELAVPAAINQALLALVPSEKCNQRFLMYWLINMKDLLRADASSNTQDNLNAEKVANLVCVVPGAREQGAISDFLDRETARIDALIAEQEKLLALLAEKRQATISHAVTRGLDPNVPMKNSGIAWLGEVPAHWRIAPLKHLVSFKSGGTPSKDRLDYWGGNIPWASAKDLKSDELADTTERLTQAAMDAGAAMMLPAGTILVVVRGMILARTFPVTQTLVPMAINQDLKGVRPGSEIDATFLAWLLRGTASESLQRLDEAGHGTKALRMEAWTSMEVPVPPKAEQQEIAGFIANRTARLGALRSEALRAIDVLRERRSALISAAVTGQIDVRGLVDRDAA